MLEIQRGQSYQGVSTQGYVASVRCPGCKKQGISRRLLACLIFYYLTILC
jgi:hypothetical protein